MNPSDKINLLDFDLEDMRTFFAAKGEKAFRAVQVIKWIHQRDAQSFEEMTDLSKALRDDLKASACIEAPEVVLDQTSTDGTRKWLLKIRDDKEKLKTANGNNIIEMVFIPEDDRGTLCVSSQVGCSLDCSFCATARQGFNRNLTAAEVIGQVWLANRLLGRSEKFRPVTNVVLMGMGEPLHNFKNVAKALNLMMDDNSYGLSKRRVTLSTSGVVPAIDRLREVSEVSLAISLHAPNDELRNKLVPLNIKHPISELLAACRRYVSDQHKRQITFEYVMLDGVNDQPEHARQLVKILRGIPGKVNLIPFNPFPNAGYKRSPLAVINRFREIVQAGGLVTVTRKTRGEDIDAACGQLVGKVNDMSQRYLKFEKPRFGAAAS